jgi:uncharacterized protein
MYDAYKRKDLEAILGLLETEIEIYQTTAVPWGGRYRGREGTQQFLGRLMAHVDSVVEIEELFDAGERVVEIGRSLGWVKGPTGSSTCGRSTSGSCGTERLRRSSRI